MALYNSCIFTFYAIFCSLFAMPANTILYQTNITVNNSISLISTVTQTKSGCALMHNRSHLSLLLQQGFRGTIWRF